REIDPALPYLVPLLLFSSDGVVYIIWLTLTGKAVVCVCLCVLAPAMLTPVTQLWVYVRWITGGATPALTTASSSQTENLACRDWIMWPRSFVQQNQQRLPNAS
ncbi:unnamed protein product, partial [Ectocarpus sp. 12 AP-2014]